jgi:GNAT-like C-terminal domain/N-acyltransferase N-terminal domain
VTSDTVAAMRSFWPSPSTAALQRVRDFNETDLSRTLKCAGLAPDKVQQIVRHWSDVQQSPQWSSLLAAGCTMVSVDRGNIDAAIPIWSDLHDEGAEGRLFYFYLFALCFDEAVAYLRQRGTPENVIDSTMNILAQHSATYERKWGDLGVEAGWWMLIVLRGELLQIGSLEFHLVSLGVGTLSPEWYDESVAAALGPGFRRGDSSLGLHIPQDADLSPPALDRTFAEARSTLGKLWPAERRRLATCRSWIMDDRLTTMLRPDSNLVRFQQRFELVPGWVEDDDDVLDFVFRLPATAFGDLPKQTSLERAVIAILERGEHWHTRSGWFDFDGQS